MNWEINLLNLIQSWRTPIGDKLMIGFTRLGDKGIFLILLTLLLLILPKTRKLGLAAAIALVLQAIPTNLIIKPLAARTRPFNVNTAIKLLVEAPKDFSFPSGHSSGAFAVAAAITAVGERKSSWIVWAAAAGIAFSRLYLYVHFPTDVLVGILIGVLSGYAAGRIVDQKLKRI